MLNTNTGRVSTDTIINTVYAHHIKGSSIKVLQNTHILTTTTADARGNYRIPELPQGIYILEVEAPGFLRSSQENISIAVGEDTSVNFSLSPLLSQGELRLVLSWGDRPRDLDSHLWLPLETSYHAYFGR